MTRTTSGAPPEKRSGPQGAIPESRSQADTPTSNLNVTMVAGCPVDTELVRRARELVAQIDDPAAVIERIGRQARADLAAWYDASRLAFAAGRDVGRQDAIAEIEQAEQAFAAHMSAINGMRSYAEQEHIRWDGPRVHFGDPRPGDHQGGPVEWGDA